VAFFALIWDHFFPLRKGFSSSSAFFVSAIRPVSSSGGGNVSRASFLIAASFLRRVPPFWLLVKMGACLKVQDWPSSLMAIYPHLLKKAKTALTSSGDIPLSWSAIWSAMEHIVALDDSFRFAGQDEHF
jgi:hypothetical protein